jgi:hypothetical protein
MSIMGAVDDKPKTMLLIGTTLPNCDEFLGVRPDGTRADVRRSQKVPETSWPNSEAVNCFRFALVQDGQLVLPHLTVPETEVGYDSVIVTYEAAHYLYRQGYDDKAIQDLLFERMGDNAWSWVETNKKMPGGGRPESMKTKGALS